MAMSQELIDWVNSKHALADARNLALYNPVVFRLPLSSLSLEQVLVVFSYREPDYRSYPFNVIWVPSDPILPDFKTVLRRSGKASTVYRNTWTPLEDIEELIDEAQFYDSSFDNTFLLGEVGPQDIVPATVAISGIVQLEIEPVDPEDPVVVETTDPRMTNARTPLAHTHPVEPYTQINGQLDGSTRVQIQGSGPQAGQVLRISGQSNGDPTLFYASWITLTQTDIEYTGPSFDSLSIVGSNTVNESSVTQYQAQANFSDSSTQTVSAVWSLVSGTAASITTNGQLTANAVTGDQTVTIRASYTHAPSGVTQTVDQVITVTDQTVVVTLTSISIQGPATQNESTVQTYTVLATFSDSSTSLVIPQVFTSSNPSAGTLNSTNGQFTAAAVGTNTNTTIHAEYTYLGVTQQDDHSLSVIDTTLYPVSVQIQGTASMDESTSQTFTALVTYSNASTAVRPGSWTRSNASAGTISSSSGIYDAAAVTSDENDIISVSVTEAGTTVTDTFNLTVVDVPVTFDSITINGGASVDEGLTSQYTVTGHFSDSSTANLTANTIWSITVGSAYASINASGLLTANAVTVNQSVTIQAQTTDPGTGTTITNTRVITVNNVPARPIYGESAPDYSIDAAFLDSALTSDMPSVSSGLTLSLNLGAGEYGYYAMPASFGNATFIDQSNGLPGGWDGATWTSTDDANGFSSNTGPFTVTYQGESWKVYRTDYPALGVVNFTVNFS
jgi:hypothetical protein